MTLAERPSIPGTRFAERLERAAGGTAAAGLDALLIGVGSDLRYLTGYEAMPLERLTVLVLVTGQDPFIVVPRLERGAAESGLRTAIEIRTWDETDDPYAMVAKAVAAEPGVLRESLDRVVTLLLVQLLRADNVGMKLADGIGEEVATLVPAGGETGRYVRRRKGRARAGSGRSGFDQRGAAALGAIFGRCFPPVEDPSDRFARRIGSVAFARRL